MTLLWSAGRFAAVLLVFGVAVGLGFRIMLRLRCTVDERLEGTLFASGIGFFVLELCAFGLSIPGWLGIRTAWLLIMLSAALVGSEWLRVWTCAAHAISSLRTLWHTTGWWVRLALAVIAGILVLESLLASAPLTGSDAMHYHFNAPLLELAGPLRPRFDFTLSFLTGESHLLITLGLALGSDRISLGLIYLGGLLTAAGLFVITRRLASPAWAVIAVLIFLIAPMVFWQITTSGSPDIWMGFYLCAATLAAAHALETGNSHMAILAGLFAGNAAGVKYTGWIIPVAVCIYLLFLFRPWKGAIGAGVAAFLGGCLPLVRNAMWSRDPFFPLFSRWLDPKHFNNFATAFMIANARASGFSLAPLHLISFPFLLTLKGDDYGLGQYFGPAILAFMPLFFFARWDKHVARLGALACALALLANAFSAQMGRFLLPHYAIGIALVLSGLAGAVGRMSRTLVRACAATIVLFVLFACVSDLVYARNFLPVAVGLENREAFLRRMAPDYQFESFVNETLSARKQNERGVFLSFFRHAYYLRVPYVNGDPATSWLFDPGICAQPSELLRALRAENVEWVEKGPDYPPALSAAFEQLESEGDLIPIASATFDSFSGPSRIYNQRKTSKMTIFQLRN